MGSQLLVLALDFFRHPVGHPDLVDVDRPLPECFDSLATDVGQALSSDNIEETASKLESTASELDDAVRFLIRHALLAPGGDHYRELGVQRNATADQIKRHYQVLIRLFHPDRAGDQLEWAEIYAPRINEAYRVLRTPALRKQYDETLEPLSEAAGAAPQAQARDKVATRSKVAVSRAPAHYQVSRRQVASWSAAGLGFIVVVLVVLFYISQERDSLALHGDPARIAAPTPAPSFLGQTPASSTPTTETIEAEKPLTVEQRVAASNISLPDPPTIKASVGKESVDDQSDIDPVVDSAALKSTEAPISSTSPRSPSIRPENAVSQTALTSETPLLSDDTIAQSRPASTGPEQIQSAETDSDPGEPAIASTEPVKQQGEPKFAVPQPVEPPNPSQGVEQEPELPVAVEATQTPSQKEPHPASVEPVTSVVASQDVNETPDTSLQQTTSPAPSASLPTTEQKPTEIAVGNSEAPGAATNQNEARPHSVEKEHVVSPTIDKTTPVAAMAPSPAVEKPQQKSETNDSSTTAFQAEPPPPDPIPKNPAADPPPPALGVSAADARQLIEQMVTAYEDGDVEKFVGLFSPRARVNDGRGTAFIRKDYSGLFSNTSQRRLDISALDWQQQSDGSIAAMGQVRAAIKDRPLRPWRKLTGTIEFEVAPGRDGLLITKMLHSTR